MIARKASAIVGQTLMARAEDASAKPQISEKMNRLMDFGRNHSDIVKIKGSEGD